MKSNIWIHKVGIKNVSFDVLIIKVVLPNENANIYIYIVSMSILNDYKKCVCVNEHIKCVYYVFNKYEVLYKILLPYVIIVKYIVILFEYTFNC